MIVSETSAQLLQVVYAGSTMLNMRKLEVLTWALHAVSLITRTLVECMMSTIFKAV